MPIESKLDPQQIIRRVYDDETYANKVKIVDTEINIALDKAEDTVAISKSTDKHVLSIVDGSCELNVIQYESLYIVGNDITVRFKIGDVIVDTVTSEVVSKCRIDNILAETAIIESTSSEVIILGR